MYILYVDESGDTGLGAESTRHYVLAGIALFEGAWRKVTEYIENIQRDFFPDAGVRVEFHFKHLRHGKGVYSHLTHDDRNALWTRIESVWQLHHRDFSSFCVIIDKHTCGPLKSTIEHEVFEQLSSRFNLFLKRRWAEGFWHKGIIVFDRRTTTQDRILQSLQRTFQQQGHRWAPLDNVIETVFTLPSLPRHSHLTVGRSPGRRCLSICRKWHYRSSPAYCTLL
ncbi:MAG: DUF3800 domain-containing protein [Calditrichaeota bacterium]|nr:DUF3800 domain-containing protein [Calditrichota bacterium]